MKIETDDDWKLWAAQVNAKRHLALYDKERNGLLIWKAYMEYRRCGVPVPESLLKRFDQFAEKLLSTSGPQEIAAALEMTGKGGGPQGASALKGKENSRDIVEKFHIEREENSRRSPERKRTIKAIAEEVGKAFGIPGDEVKTRYSQWLKACKSDEQPVKLTQRDKPPATIADLAVRLSRKS